MMRDEDFNIRPFGDFVVEKRVAGQSVYDLFRPAVSIIEQMPVMDTFEVTEYEEGRIDLVIEGMYGDLNLGYADLDIILYINGIDNPLSIMKGDILLYPPLEAMGDMRWIAKDEKFEKAKRNRTLGVPVGQPNKTTRKDKNRIDYLDKVAFPPTINEVPRPGVIIENGQIKIGGVG